MLLMLILMLLLMWKLLQFHIKLMSNVCVKKDRHETRENKDPSDKVHARFGRF